MRIVALWSVLLAGCATGLAAQDRPDFSGRWILEDPVPATGETPRALTVRQTLVRTTALGAQMAPWFRDLTIQREFENEVRSETYQIGVVGGVVGGVAGAPDGRVTLPRRSFSVQ
jgi:hypothetical protein